MSKLIAIVDDEEDILELVAINLRKSGFEPKVFADGAKFFKFIAKQKPELVILDIMLPDMDGFEICRNLKKDSRYDLIPIIMLTAKADETDKILGLEFGADDYVTKPFSPKELVARVKAVLRRNERKSVSKEILIGGILKLDFERFKAFVDGRQVELTTTEFKLLELFASKIGFVFSRENILDHLWGEKAVLDRTVDVHIKNLREKLGKAGKFIKNIRSIGYKLEE
ncbi:MAG: response regulator transcription factor [Endomicrobiales bacterium]|nr:response regulator transcription factor [Endomicrobiales bacterium]